MPTFGSSTIRRFATNASEMKKLAARDFEDLLQVSLAWRKRRSSSDFFFSAVSLYLKDYCKSHIIQLSWRYYIEQQNGMHLQNFGYILKVLYSISNGLQRSLGSWRGSLGTPRNLLLRHSNSQRKQRPERGAKSLARARREQRQAMHLGRNPNFWTFTRTNGMHSGTMFVPSVSSVQQMGSQPKSLVNFSLCIWVIPSHVFLSIGWTRSQNCQALVRIDKQAQRWAPNC